VEGSHVRTGETAKLDFRGLVILVGVDLKTVLRVLLPFFLLNIKVQDKRKPEKLVR
jgi:hypothetical protein